MRGLSRRDTLVFAGALTAGGFSPSRNTAQTRDIANNMAERLELGVRAGLLSGLHATLAIRDSATILEAYFPGLDENWGRPLGEVAFGPDTLHDLRSVTKSVTSLLYGIALGQGKVPPPEAPLLDAFPQYPDLADDPQRTRWTIGHALNMTLGTEWNEDLPYTDPRNSEIAMERSDDRYRFILDRPILSAAGSRWSYNGGCSALIGYIVEQGAGMTLSAFAQQHLFEPLGIETHEWNGGSDGVLSAASGLRLAAPDLARVGQAFLAGGDGVIPAEWISRCKTPQVEGGFGAMYSNQWYLTPEFIPALGRAVDTVSARGNGGQRLFILPEVELVVVTYAGNYNAPDQWINPTLVLRRIVLAGLS